MMIGLGATLALTGRREYPVVGDSRQPKLTPCANGRSRE